MHASIKTILTNTAFLFLSLILFTNIVSGTEALPFNARNVAVGLTESNPNIMVMPFELIGNLIVVQAKVNDQVGNFVVDTGVDMMVLHTRFFRESYSSLPVNITGINKQTAEMKITQVNFKWNGIVRKKELARVVDLSLIEKSKGINIIGFIGYPILKKFEILFDYQSKTLTLFRLDRKGNRLDKFHLTDVPTHQIKLKMAYHFPYITLKNGGEPIHLLLDSGAEMNILSPQAEEKLSKNLVYQRTRHLIGFSQERIPCKEYLVKNIKVQNVELQPMRTLIQNMEGFNESLSVSLDGFFGYEFISQHKTAINFKRKEMMIWENKVEKEKPFIKKAIVLDDF